MRYILMLLSLLLFACSTNPSTEENNGPVLIDEVAVEATTPGPTRILSPTPEITIALGVTNAVPTGEVLSPLEQVTVDADFILVTPTLPPSKTPTTTPTLTETPTVSPTPSVTVTATATLPAFPTSIIEPVTAVVAQPQPLVCDSVWFFTEPRPDSCPAAPPTAAQAVYQSFENGYMVWLSEQDAIFAMYTDAAFPRWEVYRDRFEEDMPHEDPEYTDAPSPNLWQPRRGFGLLWRNDQAVRERIGWATIEMEIPYSVQIQSSGDGSFFFSDPEGGVFSLIPNGQDWFRYSGFAQQP